MALFAFQGASLNAQDNQLQLPDFGGGGFNAFGPAEPNMTLSSSFVVDEGKKTGVLTVYCDLDENCYTYPLTPSTLKVVSPDSSKVKLLGQFEPNQDPTPEQEFGETVLHFLEDLSWTVPIEFSADTTAEEIQKTEIELSFDGQVCIKAKNAGEGGKCRPFSTSIKSSFSKFVKPPTNIGEIKLDLSSVTWKGEVSSSTVAPGDSFTLKLTAVPDAGYHLYYLSSEVRDGLPLPTQIVISKAGAFQSFAPTTSSEVKSKPSDADSTQTEYYYDGPVEFELKFTVPDEIKKGKKSFNGLFGYQACFDAGCDQPTGGIFSFDVNVGDKSNNEPAPVVFDPLEDGGMLAYNLVKNAAEKHPYFDASANAGEFANLHPVAVLGLAFLAGLILNIMPCVLPVIGLKIMSFVQQAGENPRRIFMLNFVFVLGLLTVFMVLATLAVVFGLGWGHLFRSLTFKIVMVGIVFAFGLSFLGVWEIPLPGFVGGGAAGKAAQKEGYSGAFVKGILTTILATPCSGPLLIPAVTWAIAQPAWLTYLAFFFLGLGMASPYLLIGAFPKLVGFLPKPGAWMETFKQLMGFTLLATGIFLINAIEYKYLTPTLVLMLIVGIGCWWVGRIPYGSPLSKSLMGYAQASVLILLGVYFSYKVLIPQHELEWVPFSNVAVEDELAEGNIVFVDFTADW